MNTDTFQALEGYMQSCMADSAHDVQHVYRVLYYAMELAAAEPRVDYDVLITASLLHDIGRKEQLEDPAVCHAAAGAEKAGRFLRQLGTPEAQIEKITHCIRTHRYSKGSPPQTVEAKLLFDADKLDVTGAVGIARTLLYQGTMGQSLYTLTPEGLVSDGTGDRVPGFFQEYKRKLEGLYDGFLTVQGRDMAQSRQAAAVDFYNALLAETNSGYCRGQQLLQHHLEASFQFNAPTRINIHLINKEDLS